jgi:hypothetical protein
MKPTMARLTLARKIAAITLTLWKKGEGFDAEKLRGCQGKILHPRLGGGEISSASSPCQLRELLGSGVLAGEVDVSFYFLFAASSSR